MNLDHLEDFLALAQELNFSRAAERRNITQPAFSRRIRALEDHLRAPLIRRSTRHVSLTPAGQVLRARAEALTRMAAETRQEVAEAAGRADRSLNLAATHALSYTFVPRWLMQMAGPSRLGTLNMVSDTQRAGLRMLQAGDVSFLICHTGLQDADALPDRQFRHHLIGRDSLVPLCAPGPDGEARWRLGGAAVPVIAYGAASGLHAILADHWARTGTPAMSPGMSSVLAATNLELAKEGQGIAWLPLSLAEADLAGGTLVHAGGPADAAPLRIAIHRPRARLSPHCEAFWQRVTDHAIDAQPT